MNFAEKVVLGGGQTVIYVDLKDALYGALIVSLLFWRDLSGALRYWDFKPNLYDSYVMKKMVDGKQLMICWHMDDLKIFHISQKVVDRLLSLLTTKYRHVSPLSLS